MFFTQDCNKCPICSDDSFLEDGSDVNMGGHKTIFCRKSIATHFYSIKYETFSMQVKSSRFRISSAEYDYDVTKNYSHNTTKIEIYPSRAFIMNGKMSQDIIFELTIDKIVDYDLSDPVALIKKFSKYLIF